MAEVSSTTKKRLSLCGLMKRISCVSFRCNKVPTYMLFSTDFLAPPHILRLLSSSLMMSTSDTLPHAPQILVLPWELPSTLNFQSFLRTWQSSRPSPIRTTSRSAAFTASTQSLLMPHSISQTREDSDAQRRTSFKICTTVSRLWSMLRKPFPETDANKKVKFYSVS